MSLKVLRVAALVVVPSLFVAGAAEAVKLRRPYAPTTARNYGFDNNGSASGCRDNNCGGTCYDTHRGTDFPVPLGTDVLAGAAGTVTKVFNGCANYGGLGNTCGGSCGNYVRIRHADGDETLYCHMMLDSLVVSVGSKVACGQKIGRSASSGSSTGPHLHVAVAPGGGAYIDSYSGSCTSSKGYWVSQAAAPGASCECTPSPEVCNGVDDDCDGAIDEGGVCCTPTAEVCNGKDDDCDGAIDEDEVCDVEELERSPETYAPTRTSDVDGDGRADVCGRGGLGFWCHLSKGDAFGPAGTPAGYGDKAGFGELRYAATIRMGDVDGDGRADVCARGPEGIECHLSTGHAFGGAIGGPDFKDESGWKAPKHALTFQLADLDGDGKDEICARGVAGLKCARFDGTAFGTPFAGPPWSDAAGFASANKYGTLRFGDVNGDGRDDACIRSAAGIECWLAGADGFDEKITGPALSDANGWGDRKYWSTIRLADVNGDRKADLCARWSKQLTCWPSTGDGFGAGIDVAELSDANGWDDPANYRTLRIADVDGDGTGDLCIRANAGVVCWRWDGSAFKQFEGPKLADEGGFDDVSLHGTLMLGDATGDRRADLFARIATGGTVHLSTGAGFAGTLTVDEFKTAGGWGDAKYWSTLRFGGPRCQPKAEVCNGADDDCDGLVDEDGVCAGEDAGLPGGSDAGSDAGAPTGPDASNPADPADDASLQGSCGCRAAGGGAPSPSAWLLAAPLALLTCARRRRR